MCMTREEPNLHLDWDWKLHLKLGHVKVEPPGPGFDSRKMVSVSVGGQAPAFVRKRCDGSETGPALRDGLDEERL